MQAPGLSLLGTLRNRVSHTLGWPIRGGEAGTYPVAPEPVVCGGGLAPGADDNTMALSAGRGWAAFLASEKPVIPGARKTAQLERA